MGRKNKRSFEPETDCEKVSPPSKMAKNITASVASEILAKLSSIEARFGKLELEVAEISKVVREFEALKTEVTVLKKTCEGFQRLELEMKTRSVLIRGLKFTTTEKYETRQQTKAALAAFFEKIGTRPHLVDYQRLGGLRANEDGSKVAIRVQFSDVDQKLGLFQKMKEQGRTMQDVSILTDYPSFQLPDFKRLSEAGYRIRTETPGTRTRVVSKGLELILQRRASPADRWTPVSL
jgi:hypothetical protein